MKTKQRAFLQKASATILSLVLLAFLFACNPGAFGTLDRKVAIDEIFESGLGIITETVTRSGSKT